MSRFIQTLLCCAAALVAAPPWAQTARPPQNAAPPAPAYRSAFEGYRPFEAAEVQDWRRSNDTVRDIGGWRAYAREIEGGAPPAKVTASAPAAPAAAPAPPQGQRGHHR